MLYLTIKLLHILLVVTALGANLTYGVWFARAKKNPAFAETALRGIKFIDDYVANPAYVLLLPTGAAMVALGGIGFGTRWVAWAMGLWVLAIAIAYLVYSPLFKRLIRAVADNGIAIPEYRALEGRANAVAASLAVIILVILVLMVFKPV